MILSQTAQYAVRAICYLATSGKEKWHLTKDVAEITRIPAPYLARIMSTLAKRGILKSRTGMGGGFCVTEANLQHSLYDVVIQFDNLENMTDCIFGFAKCCEDEFCILHERWTAIKDQLIKLLKSTSLKDLRDDDKIFDWPNIEI